jgi:hypothetical protein
MKRNVSMGIHIFAMKVMPWAIRNSMLLLMRALFLSLSNIPANKKPADYLAGFEPTQVENETLPCKNIQDARIFKNEQYNKFGYKFLA